VSSAILEILFRDEHVVAVDKPAGMLVHRDPRHPDATVVLQTLRDLLGEKVYPVHRLDRPTSGVLVLAFHRRGAARLQKSLARAEKHYTALVRWPRRHPAVVGTAWDCVHPLPNKRDNLKDARTRFTVLESFRRCALVRAQLFTGRYHQVRKHAHHEGHTLLAEPVYGEAWLSGWAAGRLGLRRLFLHMGMLRLPHPASGDPLELGSPLPEELATVLSNLRHCHGSRSEQR